MTSWERDRSRRKKLCTSVPPLVLFLLTFCSRGPTFSFCTEPCKLWCSPCLRGLLSDCCLSVTMLWGSPSHTESQPLCPPSPGERNKASRQFYSHCFQPFPSLSQLPDTSIHLGLPAETQFSQSRDMPFPRWAVWIPDLQNLWAK